MRRLAAREDGNFLEASRNPQHLKRYRRIRHVILRRYLRELFVDFQRLHAIAHSNSVSAGPEESALALFEQRLGFVFHFWTIEARLLLDRIVPQAIDLQPLLSTVESFAAETRIRLPRPLRFGAR